MFIDVSYEALMMKISKEIKRIVQIIALLLAIGGGVYLTSTATMTMGEFPGNGR